MKDFRFHFDSIDSPTQFNLKKHLEQFGFKSTKKLSKANFSDSNLTLPEHLTQMLEYKHLLADLTAKHCPDVMPLTFAIDDHNFREVINTIKRTIGTQNNTTWILKPALLNNAEGIKVFSSLLDLEKHFQGTKRYDGQHVLQQYIDHPHLLNNHKYTFRIFVVITNFSEAFMYQNGYFNVGRSAYQANNFENLDCHLTNEHLHADHSPNVWQIPTTRCPNFEMIYEKMRNVIQAVITALSIEAPALFEHTNNTPAFSFFGFDFILDVQLKAWLLEVNHAPCFPKDENHALQEHLYNEFWKSVVSSFVMPIVENRLDEAVVDKSWDHLQVRGG